LKIQGERAGREKRWRLLSGVPEEALCTPPEKEDRLGVCAKSIEEGA
jgi:hypothetical protein